MPLRGTSNAQRPTLNVQLKREESAASSCYDGGAERFAISIGCNPALIACQRGLIGCNRTLIARKRTLVARQRVRIEFKRTPIADKRTVIGCEGSLIGRGWPPIA
jgi:hypothetical protein